MATLRGELICFRVRGQDFWGVGTVRTLHDGGDVTVVGKVLGAREGDTLELDGDFSTHDRYGVQFRVRSCEVVLPSDVSGVVGWLASKLPQISRRRAEQLVERHGVQGVWALLDRGDADALCQLDGITPDRAREILDAYGEHQSDRDRIVLFKSWGLTDNQVARVLAEWGDDAEQLMAENPYALIECVPGFGWKRADAVAQRMGVALDSPPRLAAGLMHAMNESLGAGHCYVAQGKLVALVSTKVCAVQDEDKVRRVLEDLLERQRLVRIGPNIYVPKLARAECRLAAVFAARAKGARRAA